MNQKSYTSLRTRPIELLREARHLYKAHTADVPDRVTKVLTRLQEMEILVSEHYALELHGLQVLDVGAGQRLLQMTYFSRSNSVVGIDRDVIVQGADFRAYFDMIRTNGLRRTAKTVVRKAVGIDRKYRDELMRQVPLPGFARLPVLQMDAANLVFQDAAFDFVYSTTVFQHLPDPRRVVDEIVRVLRPGGVFYIDFMPFTGKTGSLDIRTIGGRSSDVPPWAHLRPHLNWDVHESAYLNRLSLPDWRRLFEEGAPGCHLILRAPDRDRLEHEVRSLWAQKELLEYDMDELVTAEVVALWQKPGVSA
jgi:SAM-dependent methyltransferase